MLFIILAVAMGCLVGYGYISKGRIHRLVYNDRLNVVRSGWSGATIVLVMVGAFFLILGIAASLSTHINLPARTLGVKTACEGVELSRHAATEGFDTTAHSVGMAAAYQECAKARAGYNKSLYSDKQVKNLWWSRVFGLGLFIPDIVDEYEYL